MKKIIVHTNDKNYPIFLEEGVIDRISTLQTFPSKMLVVSDHGVPEAYRSKLMKQFPHAIYLVLPSGEETKSFDTLRLILEILSSHQFTRSDCVLALGGGVIGDLAGFAASIYMRGIAFYNCPTTLLSQLDSSIGGKTAIDFMGHKNLVGSFYQPTAVFIDPLLIRSLDKRQIASGLAEAIKCGMIQDETILSLLEKNDLQHNLSEVIERSIEVKRHIVEEDEKESDLRRLLNFGHSYGHAIESIQHCLHGEAVSIGMMMAVKNPAVQQRLKKLLELYGLPTCCTISKKVLYEEMKADKKMENDSIVMVRVDEIGHGYLQTCSLYKEVFDE